MPDQQREPLLARIKSGADCEIISSNGENKEKDLPEDSYKIRIALIYGGTSGEHSISCVTAGAVMAALDPQRYEILSIGITRDGRWVLGETDPSKLCISETGLPHVASSSSTIVIPAGDGSQSIVALDTEGVTKLGTVDVAFPLLHGPFGEDGTIQGLLEMANIPYVGCGVFASAAGMDKLQMKVVLDRAGIAVAPYVAVTPVRWETEREAVLAEVAQLKFPVYVKPARGGSSLGITRVSDIADLDAAIALAQGHDPKVLIEEGVTGREVECGVLGGHGHERARVSLPGEVILDVPEDEFYDFDHKYLDTQMLTNQIPADLPHEMLEKVRHVAIAAFESFGCEGLSRVDCFVTNDGDVLVNEINTMPGFTPFSMYPKLWEYMGLSYAELVDELIGLALERGVGLH